jgi:hypothetical protein
MVVVLDKSSVIIPEFVIANRKKYCDICHFTSILVGKHPLLYKNTKRSSKWNKIAWLLDYLLIFDIVVWMDFDALIIKPNCDWIHRHYDFNIARDVDQPLKYNSGVLVTTPSSRLFLERVWKHNDFGKGQSDQRSINYVLKNNTYDFGILEREYNNFPTPPRQCNGYKPPKYKPYNQSQTIVRHRAGQFSGGRTLDGRIVKCAYDQIDFKKEAYSLHEYKVRGEKSKKTVAILTVIV